MEIFKKLKWLIFLIICLVLPLIARAETNKLKLYLFWQDGCPHCTIEKAWLADLQKVEPYASSLEVSSHDVIGSDSNLNLLKQLAEKLDFSVSAVPITIIGNHYFIGFDNQDGLGATIKDAIDKNLSLGQPFIDLSSDLSPAPQPIEPKQNKNQSLIVPFFGQVDLRSLSLPALSIIIGLVDGFNPCAMWSLLFLINLLLGMKNRKKMWLLGSTFIIGSAAVYFVFMVAWLNLILFLGFVLIVRIIIGLVAVITGVLNLRKFWKAQRRL